MTSTKAIKRPFAMASDGAKVLATLQLYQGREVWTIFQDDFGFGVACDGEVVTGEVGNNRCYILSDAVKTMAFAMKERGQ